ncbi:uncharacterized protein SCHCODRAFT_02633459 [Schizophyllum commune H4-8]|nr:uncharacterized protein SCHCODRAFT_02633459 [Schizophyllum commune H4-8]KAI5889071.1 hypothetical protein SCHCODRAFT_02633459 [Schizophyllum commune H4-8]
MTSDINSDSIDRVRSLYAPSTSEEVEALCDRLSEVQIGLQDCASEIARLEYALSLARQRRGSLREEEANIKALLSPVRAVPPEILAEIAVHTLPDKWFEDVIGIHIWAFSHVCHSWREVALSIPWVWSRLRLPTRTNMASESWEPTFLRILSFYLSRSGRKPLSITTMWNQGAFSGYWENSQQPMWAQIWDHIDRLRELEVYCSEFEGFPFPPTLPALEKLVINNYLSGELHVNAPSLRVLELVETSVTAVEVHRGSLRALRIRCDMFGDDFLRIGECQGLEVLSLTQETSDIPSWLETHSISLPSLHTLELCRAAIEIAPYIHAPSLQHFMLDDVRYYNHYDIEISPEDVEGLSDLLKPVEHITLRNTAHYDTNLLHELMSIPRRLRVLSLTEDTDPRSLAPRTIPRDLFLKLIAQDEGAFPYPHLSQLRIVNGTKGISWEGYDIALVQSLLEYRSPPRNNCAPLERLEIQTPFAILPVTKECMEARTTDGKQILDISRCATSIPVEKSEPACFY